MKAWCLILFAGSLMAGDTISAVKNGDKVALRALIQKKADVNATEADGSTALQWASYRDDL